MSLWSILAVLGPVVVALAACLAVAIAICVGVIRIEQMKAAGHPAVTGVPAPEPRQAA